MVGGEFVIHNFKKKTEPDNERFFDENVCEVAETITPRHNNGIVFLNTNQSLHSVNNIISIAGKRKFIYLALNF